MRMLGTRSRFRGICGWQNETNGEGGPRAFGKSCRFRGAMGVLTWEPPSDVSGAASGRWTQEVFYACPICHHAWRGDSERTRMIRFTITLAITLASFAIWVA